jgi:putative two-component system protein, hydrogenase maturation factor HypX/HoxX
MALAALSGVFHPFWHGEQADRTIFPAAQVLGKRIDPIAESPLALRAEANSRSFRELRYVERDQVGYLYFDFYNGAMSTQQCRRLRDA